MNLVNARKIIKQHAHTVRRITNVLDNAPTSTEFVFRTLRKQGGKDSHNDIAQYIHALVMAGKVFPTQEGLFTTDPNQKTQPAAGRITTKMHDVWPTPARAPDIPVYRGSNAQIIAPALHTEPPNTEPPQELPAMDISQLSAQQLTSIADQMQKLAEQKSRELNPELLRQMLEAIEGVVSASDLLAESLDKLRGIANVIRKDRGLPVAKG